jgi:CRISPR-associated protein Csb2
MDNDLLPRFGRRVACLLDRWALKIRRYRMTENVSRSRPGPGLRLEFAEPIAGPLLLGRLSHFR